MLRTLLVEDNSVYRSTLKDLLKITYPKMAFYEAMNGNEVMDKVNKYKPNLIFMDIHLPGENGLQLTKKIRELGLKSIIIILTSYDTPEYRHTAKLNGADYFLLKDSTSPNRILTLMETILTGLEDKMMIGLPELDFS